MSEFRMPSLGPDMEDATLVEWLARPGDKVKRGDIVAVVETQKGAIEIEVFEDGVFEEQLVAPGAVLPVGAVMARVSGAGEAAEQPVAAAVAPKPRIEPVQAPTLRPAPSAVARATPAARRLAQEMAVDLASVVGSGPGGAVTRADVAAKAALPAAPKAPGYDFSAMRRAIAAAMARSKREIPHYYLSLDNRYWKCARLARRFQCAARARGAPAHGRAVRQSRRQGCARLSGVQRVLRPRSL